MTTEEIDKLLEGTNDINNAILARIENEKSNGKYFNVFNILGLWSEEVRLHSSFLAELLNPKGNHGCGIIFLQEFISLFIKRKTEISYETAETFVEFSIGTISKDKTYNKPQI